MPSTHRSGSVFHCDQENTTWKDQGTGPIQLLRDISTGQVRFYSRNEKTSQISGNHIGTGLIRSNQRVCVSDYSIRSPAISHSRNDPLPTQSLR
jgi:RanBP1 domain